MMKWPISSTRNLIHCTPHDYRKLNHITHMEKYTSIVTIATMTGATVGIVLCVCVHNCTMLSAFVIIMVQFMGSTF